VVSKLDQLPPALPLFIESISNHVSRGTAGVVEEAMPFLITVEGGIGNLLFLDKILQIVAGKSDIPTFS